MSTELAKKNIPSAVIPAGKKKNLNLLKPFLYVIELTRGNSINVNRSSREIGEDEDHIKVLETILNSFEMSDFDIGES